MAPVIAPPLRGSAGGASGASAIKNQHTAASTPPTLDQPRAVASLSTPGVEPGLKGRSAIVRARKLKPIALAVIIARPLPTRWRARTTLHAIAMLMRRRANHWL